MMKSIEEIVRMGCARLERARAGEDFFQAVPAVAVGDDLVAWYLQAFGRVINTDCAKMVFLNEGYVPSDPKSVAAFHPQASQIVQQLVAEMLNEVNESSRVIFMAGGNGSGKSTFCAGAREGLSENDWIIDATLASYAPAAETMKRLQEKHIQTALVFIDRPADEAWINGVLKRATHGSHQTPRTVFESTHATVPHNVARFCEEFSNSIYFHIPNPLTNGLLTLEFTHFF